MHFDWTSSSRHCSSAAEIFHFLLIRIQSNARNSIFRASDDIGDTFRAMFSNPETLETFSMSRTKLSYVIEHGIGPVFKEELISDVTASQSPFSLQCDETVSS